MNTNNNQFKIMSNIPTTSIYSTVNSDITHTPLYILQNIPLLIFKFNLSTYSDMKTTSYWSSHIEIIYIKKGSMYICANGTSTLLKQNDVCIVNSNCLHFFHSYNDEACIFYGGILDDNLFSSFGNLYEEYIKPFFHSIHKSVNIIYGNTSVGIELSNLFQELGMYVRQKPIAYELNVLACLLKCFSLFNSDSTSLTNFEKDFQKSSNATTIKIIKYIQQNYDTNLDTKILCEVGSVSRTTCFRLFNQYTGDTPLEYIQKFRLHMATNYLTNTKLSISEIALKCGFAHQSHFTNKFKEYYKITPLQYRKQISQNND